MTSIQTQRQQREFPRRFVGDTTDLGNWDDLSVLFARLRGAQLDTAAAVERWLLDLSELQAAIAEEYSARYIEMTCHTDDPEREKAYLYYLEQIMPKCEPEYFELSRKYLAATGRAGLPTAGA